VLGLLATAGPLERRCLRLVPTETATGAANRLARTGFGVRGLVQRCPSVSGPGAVSVFSTDVWERIQERVPETTTSLAPPESRCRFSHCRCPSSDPVRNSTGSRVLEGPGGWAPCRAPCGTGWDRPPPCPLLAGPGADDPTMRSLADRNPAAAPRHVVVPCPNPRWRGRPSVDRRRDCPRGLCQRGRRRSLPIGAPRPDRFEPPDPTPPTNFNRRWVARSPTLQSRPRGGLLHLPRGPIPFPSRPCSPAAVRNHAQPHRDIFQRDPVSNRCARRRRRIALSRARRCSLGSPGCVHVALASHHGTTAPRRTTRRRSARH
jgi:hypothetical protein